MKRLVTAVLFLCLLVPAPAGLLLAHGGGALVAGPEPVGPYLVSVWLNPPQPRAGEPLHFTVGLAAPVSRAPVLDAEILVTMQSPAFPAPIVAPATTDQSINRLFYETDMEVPSAGEYATLIQVQGPEGSGDIELTVDVLEPSGINWLWVGLGGLALVLVGGWVLSRRTAVAA
jgi:hypothetical protein